MIEVLDTGREAEAIKCDLISLNTDIGHEIANDLILSSQRNRNGHIINAGSEIGS